MHRVLRLICTCYICLLPLIARAVGPSQVPEADTFPWLVSTATELNLREGPGANTKCLGTFDKGARIYAIERVSSGNWVKICFKDVNKGPMEGYVEGSYLIYETQLNSDSDSTKTKHWEGIDLRGTVFEKIWDILRVILLIAIALVILAFKDEIASFLAPIALCGGIGALVFWLLFHNGSLGFILGAVTGLLLGLRDSIILQGSVVLFLLFRVLYYSVSFPFYLLNRIQFILSEPWRYFFKYNVVNDKVKPGLRAFLSVLKVTLYLIITPLRAVNAIYYNIIVHGLVIIYDLLLEVFAPCNEKEGAGNFWLWLVLLPWRVLRYPVFHGTIGLLECVVWTIIDIFIPTITFYHGTDLTAGQSITGSRHRNTSLKWNSGTFTASQSSWGGIGVYFASRRSVALRYANDPYRLSDSNPVFIVCRVSPGIIINYSLAPTYIYNAAGENGNPPTLNSYAKRHKYTTGEWWNPRGHYWEFCLFDWKNLYNARWRIRPIYVFNDRTQMIQHIKGGMAHWFFQF